MKFKIGDEVKVIADHNRLDDIGVAIEVCNLIGKIQDIGNDMLPIKVYFTFINDYWFFAEHDLKLVGSLPNDNDNGTIRKFETGATRDTSKDKLDFEGFISPLVLRRYAQYLHKHRVQSDGTMRDSDNWQKGIPKKEYMKSKIRHGNATHLLFDGFQARDEKGNRIDIEDSLCAELFNTMGYLFEVLKEKAERVKDPHQENPIPGGNC